MSVRDAWIAARKSRSFCALTEALRSALSRTGAPAVGKHGAVSRKGRVCGAFACANDLDLLLLGAAFAEVLVAVDGVSGFPQLLLIQTSAASLGVTETFRDPRAAGIAVVATWRTLPYFLACSHCGHLSVYP